jgi:tetratricopeptide (TPR) repeat protein
VARRGAGRLRDDVGPGRASQAWREAVEAERPAPPAWEPEQWIDTGAVRDEAEQAVARGERAPRRRADPVQDEAAAAPADRDDEIHQAVGPRRAPRLRERLGDAARAYRRDQFAEAQRLVRPLAKAAPGAPSVRELYGLTLYRLGKWKDAVRELEAFRTLTGSTEQHPVLADAYRALGRWSEVDELWEELRVASPSAELVAEGRIVAAGAYADQGDLQGAIKLLERARTWPKRPQEHHLRMAYALADLFERAGDVPRARDLFTRIRKVDPDFADVRQRVRALG